MPLRLLALPELRSCELHGSRDADACVQIDAASFQGAPQLQNLCLDFFWRLEMQDGSLAQLDALTSLTVIGCALKKMPTDVASLSHTLCVLDLSNNEDLQIDSVASEWIIQCSRLTNLGLCKPDMIGSSWGELVDDGWESIEQHMDYVGYTPSLWTSESVKQLVLLPSAFHMRHGRYLKITS